MTVHCSVVKHADGLTATLTGHLGLADTARLRTDLFKCLAEQPDTLFVDLAGLSVEEPLALAVFAAVNRQASRWPGIAVLYFAAAEPLRGRLLHGPYRRLPVFAGFAEALAASPRGAQVAPSLSDDLLPISGAARHARNLVTEACLRWDQPDLVGPASLIASELVTNVVQHAGTMATMRVSLRPRFVMIAVRDGSTAEPRKTTPSSLGGRGLLLVEATAHSWGCLPSADGKVVWASLARH